MNSLTEKVRRFIAARSSDCFETVALEIFRYQFESNSAYRSYCNRLNCRPEKVTSWQQIPALPQALFKSDIWLMAFPQEKSAGWFETSGTSTTQRGKNYYCSLDLYHWSICHGFSLAFAKFALPSKIHFLFLKESAEKCPHSSLSWMFEFWKQNFGSEQSAFGFSQGTLNIPVIQKLALARAPVFVAGTAFSFVHLLDSLSSLPLPEGSVVMETGGFKGRSREIEKASLYEQLCRFFQISDDRIVNEYGMTELFSQAYAFGSNGYHHFPPWMRFRLVDPATGTEPSEGSAGLIELVDLANVENCLAIQTMDLGLRRGEYLHLLGRATDAEPRGCSLVAE